MGGILSGLRLMDADLVQEANERRHLVLVETAERVLVDLVQHGVERLELREPARRDAAEDLTPVARGAVAPDETLRLEPRDQARDPGRVLDHALDDRERGKTLRAGAAEDAQDVVLLGGDLAAALDELREAPTDRLGGQD